MEPLKDDLVRALYSRLEVRDAEGEDDSPRLTGHFAVFDEWTEINSVFEGHFMERIAPGAFKKTMKERANDIKVTFNHGRDVLGDQVLGPIEVLREDDTGAYYEVRLLNGIPELLLNGLRAGQYGASFRFGVIREEFNREAKPSRHNPAGLPERTLEELRLHEFGPVTFPAYPEATAEMRSLTDSYMLSRALEQPDLLSKALARAAALPEVEPSEQEQETAEQDTPLVASRSTQRPVKDYLGKRDATWRL
jgi:HK97 family phage prohead protease